MSICDTQTSMPIYSLVEADVIKKEAGFGMHSDCGMCCTEKQEAEKEEQSQCSCATKCSKHMVLNRRQQRAS